jgi:hypothetical protein
MSDRVEQYWTTHECTKCGTEVHGLHNRWACTVCGECSPYIPPPEDTTAHPADRDPSGSYDR